MVNDYLLYIVQMQMTWQLNKQNIRYRIKKINLKCRIKVYIYINEEFITEDE